MNKYLTLSQDEMQQLGYRVIDFIVDHFANLPRKPVLNVATPAELKALLDGVLPEQPADLNSIMDIVGEHILGNISHGDHPRFFAFVPGPSNFVGAMADAMAAGFNVCASNWLEASGPAEIERITVRWLAELCAYPATAGGTFVSGGSMANLTAIAVAREVKLGRPEASSLVYYADQAHLSISRGLRVLGFGVDQLRQIPTDDRFTMDTTALRRQLETDEQNGFLPFCVVANAGSTNTGAVDPLRELSVICEEKGMWLHVDGAYGAGAILSERGRKRLEGIELAHSITIDPHKWLFQPIESGCLLVRDKNWLRHTFDSSPEYLSDVDAFDSEVNYYQLGVQLTRQTRALKLWMSLKVFGAQAFRAAIDQGLDNAEYLAEKIGAMKDWCIVSPATLGVVTFRLCPGGLSAAETDALNQDIADQLSASGVAFIGTTVLNGVRVLRMCPINPRTTRDDLDRTIAALAAIGKTLSA